MGTIHYLRTVSKPFAMTLWVVKGGRGGFREERFMTRSVIGIGWGEMGDLSRYPDRDAMRAAYRGSFPGRSESHVNTQVAQLWAFAVRMQVGDIVVVPFLGSRRSRSVRSAGRTDGSAMATRTCPTCAR